VATEAYIIDLAANFDGADATSAQLDALSQSLIDAGADAQQLEAATIGVAAQLRAAGDATREANAALAEGNARYTELERAAIKASKAAEKAALSGKLTPELAQNAHDAIAALNAETSSLKGLEASAAAAAKAEAKLSNTHKNLTKLSSSAAGAFSEQAAAAKKSVREAEGFSPMVKQFNDLSDALSTSEGAAIIAVGAFVALAAAVVAVTLAVVAGTVAIAAWAIGLADAKREASLTAEASAVLHPELASLAGDFQAIADETGAGAQDLRAWTKQLQTAKVSAEDLPAALRAVALADALNKGQGISEFTDHLKEAKGAVGDVAAEFEALAPLVQKKMLGLGAQSAKLRKNFGDLFDDLNIDPVLEGMRILVDLFDKNTAAGESMKFLFETVFQPIIDQATNAAYVVEAFALGFLIGMTKLYIALKPAIKAVKEFFGFKDSSLTDTLDIAKSAGELVAGTFVVFIGILGALGVAAVAAAGFIMLPFIALGVLAVGVYEAGVAIYDGFVSAWNAVGDFLGSFSLVSIGTDIVRGLIDGIINMGPNVLSAITGIADGAIKAAKKALGIASPSKVFADIGGYTAEGFAVGVDDGAGMAQDAMASMVEPPDPNAAFTAAATAGRVVTGDQAASAGTKGGKADGAGKSVMINNLYLNGTKASAKDAEDLAEAVTKLLEGDAIAIAGEEAA
jgi:hypothetical protein